MHGRIDRNALNSLINLMDSYLIIITIFAIFLAISLYLRSKSNSSNQVSQNILLQIQNMKEELTRATSDQRKEVQERLDRVQNELNSGLKHSHSSMQQQFSQTSKIVQDVTEHLTKLDQTNKQVLDFSSQLKNLQNILKNPKQRGVLGEYWLETLLKNVLPIESYKMQYLIGDDSATGQKLIADAVIFVNQEIIPIDAKFSLENYNRMMEENETDKRDKLEKEFKADVKKRIDETSKYIRPEMGTLDFVFMFIPAEGVYYNLLNAEVGSGINSNSLIEYAFEKHVMIVSPTSFYAYLQTVILGLRKLKIEKHTQEIIKRVGELGKHFSAFADYHDKLGKNLGTVVNQFNLSSGELKKMSKDVQKISSGAIEEIIELDEIAKPAIE